MGPACLRAASTSAPVLPGAEVMPARRGEAPVRPGGEAAELGVVEVPQVSATVRIVQVPHQRLRDCLGWVPLPQPRAP